MKKRYILSAILLACAGLVFYLFWQKETPFTKQVGSGIAAAPAHTIISLSPDVHIVSDDYKLKETGKEVKVKKNATDTIYMFDVKKSKSIGELQLTVREVDNGDQFVFSKFFNTAEKGTSLPFKIVMTNQPSFDYYSFEEDIPQEHDRVFGTDYTSNTKGVYTMTGDQPYQLYLSQNYISKELVETYDDGAVSVLRELVNEDKYIEILDEKSTLTFHLKLRTTGENQISENVSILFSFTKLFLILFIYVIHLVNRRCN